MTIHLSDNLFVVARMIIVMVDEPFAQFILLSSQTVLLSPSLDIDWVDRIPFSIFHTKPR